METWSVQGVWWKEGYPTILSYSLLLGIKVCHHFWASDFTNWESICLLGKRERERERERERADNYNTSNSRHKIHNHERNTHRQCRCTRVHTTTHAQLQKQEDTGLVLIFFLLFMLLHTDHNSSSEPSNVLTRKSAQYCQLYICFHKKSTSINCKNLRLASLHIVHQSLHIPHTKDKGGEGGGRNAMIWKRIGTKCLNRVHFPTKLLKPNHTQTQRSDKYIFQSFILIIHTMSCLLYFCSCSSNKLSTLLM